MIPALVAALMLTQTPAAPSSPAPPPPSATVPIADHLETRRELEELKLQRAQLRRRVAELEGLIAFLGQSEVDGLSASRKAFTDALAAAGFTLDPTTGKVIPAPPKDGSAK
jgi:hypothetical protein